MFQVSENTTNSGEHQGVSDISETSIQEYVRLGTKKKLFPGDLVLYRLIDKDTWPPACGTVIWPKDSTGSLHHKSTTATTHDGTQSCPTCEAGPGLGAETTPGEKFDPATTISQDEEGAPSFSSVQLVLDDGSAGDVVHVHWAASNRSTQIHDSKLCLIDRNLQLGQLVRNKDGVLGVVTGKEVRATVQIVGTEQVIKDIPVSALNPITQLVRGQHICYQDWMGVITTVKRHLYFRLDGGMTFYLESVENDGFEKTDIYNVADNVCPGFRSQLSYRTLCKAKWGIGTMQFLTKWIPPITYLYSFAPVTAIRSEVISICVEWLTCNKGIGSHGLSEIPEPPKELSQKDFKNVTPIGIPSWDLVRPGCIRVYKLNRDDLITTYSAWMRDFRVEYMGECAPDQTSAEKRPPPHQVLQVTPITPVEAAVKVILCQTMVEINWEDEKNEKIFGTQVHEICEMIGSHPAYCPGVVLAQALLNETGKYGVVQPCATTDDHNKSKRTLYVKWIMPESRADESSVTQDLGIHEESLYDVKPHPTYALYPKGHIVLFDKPIEGQIGGAVVDLDIRAGQMLVGVPSKTSASKLWPHTVTPVTKLSVWNFFKRQWEVKTILPLPHQLIENEHTKPDPDIPNIVLNLKSYDTMNKVRTWEPEIPQFEMLENLAENHKFAKYPPPSISDRLFHAIHKEHTALSQHVPPGIWIRGYDSRLDLLSLLLLGETGTPYEDGLFMFDIQFTEDFPATLPRIKFVVYSHSLSPFVDQDGTFCISKLSWGNKDANSYVLKLASELRKLLFHKEPFFEDDRHQNLRGTEEGVILSREYNEKVFIEILTSFHNMACKPYNPWKYHMAAHLDSVLPYKIKEVKQWLRLSGYPLNDAPEDAEDDGGTIAPPAYPMLPLSKGFQMAFESRHSKMQKFFQSDSGSIDKQSLSNSSLNVSLDKSSIGSSLESTSIVAPTQKTNEELEEVVISN